MTSWLLDPLSRAYMQHAFAAIVLVGVICGVIGVFVTLRGLAFMGDALAHAIFPGVVLAFVLGGSVLVGALIAALLVSVGVGAIGQGGACPTTRRSVSSLPAPSPWALPSSPPSGPTHGT